MRNNTIISLLLLCAFLPLPALAFDGTGIWNYDEIAKNNTCGEPNTLEQGDVGILQTGNTFLIVADDSSAQGTVNGSQYTFNDKWCDGDGSVSQDVTITLSSDTAATGRVDWTYSESGFSCSGWADLKLTKQNQAQPVTNASGKWNFTQSGFNDYCGDIDPPLQKGYLEVTQTGNKITAVDNLGQQYNGFVNGRVYAVVRSFVPDGGGRTSVWSTVTLSSDNKQGAGEVELVWDNNCNDCWANWQISLSKEEVTPQYYTIEAYAAAGGTISPTGTVNVEKGASRTYQIIPDPGYLIYSVYVDGEDVGAVKSFTFSNVDADHSISAVFILDYGACESLIIETFSAGIMPPAGWKLLTTNPSTWNLYAGENNYAYVFGDGAPQDEVLLSQSLSISEGILNIWSAAESIAQCGNVNDSCDLEVWLVIGNWDGGIGDDLLVGRADDDWISDATWATSSFNLTSLLPDAPIRFGFRYKGQNGGWIALDNIIVCSDKPASPLLPFLNLLLE